MSALLLSALAAGSSGQGALYVDDVFSTYLYTGNGSTQTINNGIDLAGKGGLVWTKARNTTGAHGLWDTLRGANSELSTNKANAAGSLGAYWQALSNGFIDKVNTTSTTNVASWTFRRAPKFFDVVTYTGDGTSTRTVPHQLGVVPGFALIKKISTTGDWYAIHSTNFSEPSNNRTRSGILNSTAAFFTPEGNIFQSATTIPIGGTSYSNGLGGYLDTNTNGVSYVAYLWAHDPSTDGIIRCGSFTTDASGGATVNLGWEPQFVILKASSIAQDWRVLDVTRGWAAGGGNAPLFPNLSSTEGAYGTGGGSPAATGFSITGFSASTTYIYLAIRRPNKPPTTGTQVYNAIARTGTAAAATVTGVGFAPDLSITKKRSSTTLTGAGFVDRLRGATRWLDSSATTAETATADTVTRLDSMNGIVLGADATTSAFNTSGHTYINHFFCRAKGFFDIVCDTGTGAAHAITHGLSVAPEFVIRKSRSGATQWECWHSALTATEKLVLNSTAAKVTDATAWNSTLPTSTQFTVGTGANVNTNAATYVTYLFATSGISKVGSYTGNGTSQTINCGFATGARFILIKRTDATGDWYVWDSVRGIIAANDPHLSLNTTAAEVTTDDSVDPDASGFIVNQNTATNINVNGGSYIFLAIA